MTSCCIRQEGNIMRSLANAQWDRPAGGNTGPLFLAFGRPVCADLISNCPLNRVLTYKSLIYLLNLQFYPTALKGCHCIVFTHGICMGGRADRRQEKFVRAVSQKQ